MTWTATGDGNFEARQGNIKFWAIDTSGGPTWAISCDGGEMQRAGSADSLEDAMAKAELAAEELSRKSLP
jgi:hypothetical protein